MIVAALLAVAAFMAVGALLGWCSWTAVGVGVQ